jgi:hypothetical protein
MQEEQPNLNLPGPAALPPEGPSPGLSRDTLPELPSSEGPVQPYEATPPRPNRTRRDLFALLVAAVGWFLPGAGYLLVRHWSRALVGFCAVAALALVGFGLRGNVFPPHGTEPFDFLGFLADLGSGVFYFLAKSVEAAGPDVSRAAGDYGTRLVATSGVLNLLLLLDAAEIAGRGKS